MRVTLYKIVQDMEKLVRSNRYRIGLSFVNWFIFQEKGLLGMKGIFNFACKLKDNKFNLFPVYPDIEYLFTFEQVK